MQTDQAYKVRESRLRRVLRRHGYVLNKSRARDPGTIGYRQYQIMDSNNAIVAGGWTGNGYELTLDDVERWATRQI